MGISDATVGTVVPSRFSTRQRLVLLALLGVGSGVAVLPWITSAYALAAAGLTGCGSLRLQAWRSTALAS